VAYREGDDNSTANGKASIHQIGERMIRIPFLRVPITRCFLRHVISRARCIYQHGHNGPHVAGTATWGA
jgi:hypothetical protein